MHEGESVTAWKVSKYGVFSDPYFPVFGVNTEIHYFTQWAYFQKSLTTFLISVKKTDFWAANEVQWRKMCVPITEKSIKSTGLVNLETYF